MDKETFIGLAIARLYRSGELLEEAIELLNHDKYKSANNRAFYSIEKAMKALLAIKEISAESHNGCLLQFNMHFIRNEEGEFQKGDYKRIASVERIRNISILQTKKNVRKLFVLQKKCMKRHCTILSLWMNFLLISLNLKNFFVTKLTPNTVIYGICKSGVS